MSRTDPQDTFEVIGLTPNGSAPSSAEYPVLVAGSDGSNKRNVLVDSSGRPLTRMYGVMDDTSTTIATEDNPAECRITPYRALHTHLRDNAGTAFGTADNPIYTSGNAEILSPLPGFIARSNKVLAAGVSNFETFTMTDDIALIDFHFGGRGPGQSSIFRYVAATTEQIPSGTFNSSSEVSDWTNAGAGSSAGLTWTYTTAQFTEGTGSATVTFTQSDSNNFPALKYTFSSPKDMSAWRYIRGQVRVTVASGGAQSRAVQIILTDTGGATRTYQIAGTTTTAPFSTEQWQTLTGEIENPDASTGTFDVYNVSSVTLKLLDGGNKSGTIYWDDIELVGAKTLIERIYIDANRTFQLRLDPVEQFDIGEVLGLQYKNNDTVSREYTSVAKGVLI